VIVFVVVLMVVLVSVVAFAHAVMMRVIDARVGGSGRGDGGVECEQASIIRNQGNVSFERSEIKAPI
jgi:hypothetical protein